MVITSRASRTTGLMFVSTLLSFLLLQCTAVDSEDTPSTEPVLTEAKIERIADFQSRFIPTRNIDVWLPPGYDPEKRYAVLYMHDGQMLFDSTQTWNKQEWGVDEVAGDLITRKKVQPFIVVGVWNVSNRRHSEYFPQKPFDSLPQAYQDSLMGKSRRDAGNPLFTSSVCSDDYLKFLVFALKPHIDKTYPTKQGPENTFVAGSSMGGLISMYALCEYPDVFGGAACMSTHWPGIFETENNPIPAAFQNYLRDNLPVPGKHKIYFDYGTATLDSLYEPFQLQVDSVMRGRGYTEQFWETRKFPGANHSERSWRKRLHIPFRFLFGK